MTLDEVIKELENRQNFIMYYGQDGTEWQSDELYYLKEYRKQKEQIDALPDYYDLVNFWAESQANPPLTWEQLKTMEGKPVWVEVDEKWWGRFWAFVEVESNSYINFYQKGQEYPEDLWKCSMGKTWNAFRKERE